MPTFLSDPPFSAYLILAVVFCVAGAVWINKRSRWTLVAFALAVSVIAALIVIDLLYESPRESAVSGVKAIVKAVNERNWDEFEARISKDFRYRTLTRAGLRERMAGVIGAYDARAAVWEFNREKVKELGENQVEIVFDAKGDPKSGMAYYAHLKTTFVRESDGEWRLKSLAVYNYASKTNGQEETIPGVQ